MSRLDAYARECRIFERAEARALQQLRLRRIGSIGYDRRTLIEVSDDLEHVARLSQFESIRKRARTRLAEIVDEVARRHVEGGGVAA